MIYLEQRCPVCKKSFPLVPAWKKFCCYDCRVLAANLIRYKEVARLTDEEKKLREELLKWKKSGVVVAASVAISKNKAS